MRKATLTEAERLKKRKEAQEAYRHKVRKFTLQLVYLILRLEKGLNSSQIKESI